MRQIRRRIKENRTASWAGAALALCLAASAVTGMSSPLPLPGEREETEPVAELPGRYDAREHGQAPAIRSQGGVSTCWALTACSALEAALMPEETLIFSADHLIWDEAFTGDADSGGDYRRIMAYLSSWRGPVSDEDDPCNDGENNPDLEAVRHVQEICLLEDADRSVFQEIIRSAGPVQTSLYMNRSVLKEGNLYYNEETYAYLYPQEQTADHDVLILGWDDAYPKENFLTQPSEDGAWICQNTWGTSFGDEGIFYVSYEDANIAATGLAYTAIEEADNYDHIYQSDDCGWQARVGYGSSEAWFAAVYTAQGDEELEAAGFYTLSPDVSYELYLASDYDGDLTSAARRQLQTGRLAMAGYHTVDLKSRTDLTAGRTFALIVHVTAQEDTRPVALEKAIDESTQGVNLEGREGYISADGITWERTQEAYDSNVCLKVFTNDAGGSA